MLSTAVLVVVVLASPTEDEPRKRSVGLSIGFGVSVPAIEEDTDVSARGFFAQGEYIWRIASWFKPRAYAGMLITGTDQETCDQYDPCDVSSKIGFAGAKLRFLAPIPWVGPYFGFGLGMSVGSIQSRVGDLVDKGTNGAALHVPLDIGLALGPHHEVELGFGLLFHPDQDSAAGALAIGLEIPL